MLSVSGEVDGARRIRTADLLRANSGARTPRGVARASTGALPRDSSPPPAADSHRLRDRRAAEASERPLRGGQRGPDRRRRAPGATRPPGLPGAGRPAAAGARHRGRSRAPGRRAARRHLLLLRRRALALRQDRDRGRPVPAPGALGARRLLPRPALRCPREDPALPDRGGAARAGGRNRPRRPPAPARLGCGAPPRLGADPRLLRRALPPPRGRGDHPGDEHGRPPAGLATGRGPARLADLELRRARGDGRREDRPRMSGGGIGS
jgi:hypothetical protein